MDRGSRIFALNAASCFIELGEFNEPWRETLEFLLIVAPLMRGECCER
jgi:hypothetical protein